MVCPPCLLAGASLVSGGTGVMSRKKKMFIFFMTLSVIFLIAFLLYRRKNCKQCNEPPKDK